MTPPLNFAITGVAGYIAPRHLKANTRNRLDRHLQAPTAGAHPEARR